MYRQTLSQNKPLQGDRRPFIIHQWFNLLLSATSIKVLLLLSLVSFSHILFLSLYFWPQYPLICFFFFNHSLLFTQSINILHWNVLAKTFFFPFMFKTWTTVIWKYIADAHREKCSKIEADLSCSFQIQSNFADSIKSLRKRRAQF